MRTFRSLGVGVYACVLLLTTGCGQRFYRAETQIEPNGRVTRAIYQPAEDTPAAARADGAWQHLSYAAEVRPDRWRGGIHDLPEAALDRDHPYLVAWGEYASPAKMPGHYLKPSPQGLPDGKLVVDYQREDLVLVVEHRWKETLTDVVTLDDLRASRQQLIKLMIPIAGKCLEVGLGPEYDTSGVVDWLKTTGAAMFADLTDAFYDAGTRGELPPSDRWQSSLADVCAKYNLILRDDKGRVLDTDHAREALAVYIEGVLRDNLVRRDGREIPQQVIDDLLEWLNIKDRYHSGNPQLARLDGLARKVILDQYGSDEAFQQVFIPLASRIFGLYRVEVLGPPRKFHYAMEMPGEIVHTNGLITGDRSVQWTFEAVQAYPFGYTMECRALAPQSAVQQELLGREPLTSREAMLAYAGAIRRDIILREALRTCVKRRTFDPLFTMRERIATEKGDTSHFDVVIGLLGLPATTKATTGK
jgi:hypothetical protein